ncbi:JAB domain-containing protein [Psychromonas sp. CD1]|uniref:JAB domain-containing protein n=1 Tax=Psychromonas sp. CD1 TaxID=1979839 RepID=UPI000B9C492C
MMTGINSRHQLIEYKEIFHGTLDSAHIYPREILKAVLKLNASTVIFAHNHPKRTAKIITLQNAF